MKWTHVSLMTRNYCPECQLRIAFFPASHGGMIRNFYFGLARHGFRAGYLPRSHLCGTERLSALGDVMRSLCRILQKKSWTGGGKILLTLINGDVLTQ